MPVNSWFSKQISKLCKSFFCRSKSAMMSFSAACKKSFTNSTLCKISLFQSSSSPLGSVVVIVLHSSNSLAVGWEDLSPWGAGLKADGKFGQLVSFLFFVLWSAFFPFKNGSYQHDFWDHSRTLKFLRKKLLDIFFQFLRHSVRAYHVRHAWLVLLSMFHPK